MNTKERLNMVGALVYAHYLDDPEAKKQRDSWTLAQIEEGMRFCKEHMALDALFVSLSYELNERGVTITRPGRK